MTATVIRTRAAALTPQVSVAVAVDTASVAAMGKDGEIAKGAFLVDNRVRNGSAHEATMHLHTVCNVEDLIGFHSLPIDGAGASHDKAIITAFLDASGNVFTGAGHPRQQPPLGNGPAGNWWIGQALAGGTETYTIQLEVTVGQFQPLTFFVWLNATITAS